jgi:hypothetical protein
LEQSTVVSEAIRSVKSKVVQDKIRRFYFVGDFDVSPFASMRLSFLPKVVSQIKGEGKQSAVYRLLRCIPELHSVSERKYSHQSCNKRQKIGK